MRHVSGLMEREREREDRHTERERERQKERERKREREREREREESVYPEPAAERRKGGIEDERVIFMRVHRLQQPLLHLSVTEGLTLLAVLVQKYKY